LGCTCTASGRSRLRATPPPRRSQFRPLGGPPGSRADAGQPGRGVRGRSRRRCCRSALQSRGCRGRPRVRPGC
jgi:hypothetical protein